MLFNQHGFNKHIHINLHISLKGKKSTKLGMGTILESGTVSDVILVYFLYYPIFPTHSIHVIMSLIKIMPYV